MKPYTPATHAGRVKACDDIHHKTADQSRKSARHAAKAARHAARQEAGQITAAGKQHLEEIKKP